MTDLEDVIRDTLSAHAPEAPDPRELLAATVTRHSRRRTRRTLVAALAVGTATAAVVAIPLIVSGSLSRSTSPQTVISARPSAPGTSQVIGFHGLDVTVPVAWRINGTRCGTPVASTVIRDQGAVADCLIQRPAGVSSLELLDTPQNWIRLLRDVRTTANPRGVRVETGTIAGRTGTAVIVPAVHVLMFLDTVRPSETAAILDSIEVTDTDVTGCPMRQSALRPPTHYHPADPGALSSSVIPLEPTSIAVCHYADSWLESAALSTGNGKDRLVSTADALPRGFAHAPPSSYLPSVCTDSAADGGGAGTGFELIAQYTDRSPVTLWAHVGFCGPLGITNGLRSGRLTPTLASALSAPLHIGYAVPGRLLPGPGSTP